MDNNEMDKYLKIVLGQFESSQNYLVQESLIKSIVYKNELKNIEIENLYNDDIESDVIVMKILHIYGMFAFLLKNMMYKKVEKSNLKFDKEYSITISVTHDNINIINRKGFGLIYNIDNMIEVVSKSFWSFPDYILKLYKQHKCYNDILNLVQFLKLKAHVAFNSDLDSFKFEYIKINETLFNKYL